MEIDNYPSNQLNKTAKPKKPKAEAIVPKGSTSKGSQKTFFDEAFDAFFDTQNIPDKKHYIIFEILIPGARRMVLDAIGSFFGVKGGTLNAAFKGNGNTAYNKVTPGARVYASPDPRKATYEYDDVHFEGPDFEQAYQNAEDVLARMREDIAAYGMVSVNDYYDYAGVQGDSTGNNWGWTDLRKARVEWAGEYYVIRFPRILPLN
jgi:hypothetical protein